MKNRISIFLSLAGVVLVGLSIFFSVYSDHHFWPVIFLTFGIPILFIGMAMYNMHKEIVYRKKRAKIILVVALILFLTSAYFRYKHWGGTGILLVISISFFCFAYLPLHAKNRIEKWQRYTRKKWHAWLLGIGDFISIGGIVLGFLFRVQHWPYSNVLMTSGFILLFAGLASWNIVFSREIVLRKKAEEETQKTLEQLKEQHKLIEEKNKEILDSIHYAKRIQNSLIPNDYQFKKELNNCLKK
jgi:hypothetical protein